MVTTRKDSCTKFKEWIRAGRNQEVNRWEVQEEKK